MRRRLFARRALQASQSHYFGIRLSRAHRLDNTSARTMRTSTNSTWDIASPALPSTTNDAIRMLILPPMYKRKTNRDGKVIDNNRSCARILVVPWDIQISHAMKLPSPKRELAASAFLAVDSSMVGNNRRIAADSACPTSAAITGQTRSERITIFSDDRRVPVRIVASVLEYRTDKRISAG